MKQLQQDIQNYLNKFGNDALTSNALVIKRRKDDIINFTSFLPEDTKMMERVYIIFHEIKLEDLACKICGKKRKFRSFVKGFNKTCGNGSCNSAYGSLYSTDQTKRVAKMNETKSLHTEERRKEIRQKCDQTKRERYGEDYRRLEGLKGYKNALERGTFYSPFQEWSNTNNKEKIKETHLKAAKTLKSKIDENGLDHYDRIHQRKLNDIDKNGLDHYNRIHQRKLNDIDENGLNYYQRLHIKRLNDIDENGLNYYQRLHIKRLNDIDENGLNFYQRQTEAQYNSGRFTRPEDKDDFQHYRYKVYKCMKKFDEQIKKLPDYDLRGHANKAGSYHLDHKFSIHEGFKNCVPPYIIGNIANLEMISARNNLSKNRACSIDLDTLINNLVW
jgi:hypothetical protein